MSSRQSSADKRERKIRTAPAHDPSLEEAENQLNPLKKRSERQASQGVKLLVNREKGNNSDLSMSVESESSYIQEVKRVTPINPSPYVPAYPNKTYSTYSSGSVPQMSNPHPHSRPQKESIILNIKNFEKILLEKLKKENIELTNPNEFLYYMNLGLESYIKKVLEKLITIARIRNVNLNLYSKQSEKNPIYKIHTMNLEKSQPHSNELNQTPYLDFSIIFTKNMKQQMSLLEEYEELNLKKLRHDRAVLLKKLEESTDLKEGETDPKKNPNTEDQNNIQKPKQRVRKRDTMLKNVRNTLAKSQKREEMARHKKETQNTLETFLDNKPKQSFNTGVSLHKFDSEMYSNIGESQYNETFTKMSEVSKSEMQGTIGIEASNTKDINLTIFKNHTPSQNIKLPINTSVKRRITLKDLIQFLEGERRTPLQNLILHKAVVKLNQYSHQN